MNRLKSLFQDQFNSKTKEELSLLEFLERCKDDPSCYATAPERMLKAIGEPTVINTSDTPRLSRIFSNRKIKVYPAFSDFYGMEETIEAIVSYFKHAAQNLEEAKQIIYLLGPVGGGKSSLAERLKKLMEKEPIYVLKAGSELSPLFESPLGLFDATTYGETLQQEYGIPERYLKAINSPWAQKRLNEFEGDITKFSVVKMYPSIINQIAISKAEPGDENNQDISTLVGSVNINKLQRLGEDDPDAYGFTGALNIATQGIMEFVEMFKAPIKMLHPLLTATQEGNYNGTRRFGSIPFQGTILAHSNESEWETFKNNKNNEAFLDRINLINVPYCLRIDEEKEIYEKIIRNSELSDAPVAPKTFEMLAQFSILTRLLEPRNSDLYAKLLVYNGEYVKEIMPKAKTHKEYKDDAGVREGMDGMSTRFAYKILSKVFNHDSDEVAANPIHLMYVLEKQIKQECFPTEKEEMYLSFVHGIMKDKYAEFVEEELQKAYLESYSDYGQNLFDNYVKYADFWTQNNDYRDPDTGGMMDREMLNKELEKMEKPAAISNPKDFRNEIVNFVLRAKADRGGKNPVWTSYEKLRRVIEKRMFSNTEELLPIISFETKKKTADEEEKHHNFVDRMIARGYTKRQIQLIVNWFTQYNKS
jgi:serine protein kinase